MASCKTKLRETRNIVTNERENYKRNEDTLKYKSPYKSPLMKRLQTSSLKFLKSVVGFCGKDICLKVYCRPRNVSMLFLLVLWKTLKAVIE